MILCRGINGKEYILEKKIGAGGEGTVYTLAGNNLLAAKIYKQEKFQDSESRKKMERKLKAMILLQIPAIINGTVRLSWPQDVLYLNGEMVGFVMPKINTTYKIYDIYREGAVRKKIYPHYTWQYSVMFAYHLAWIVNYLHEYDIVIGDFNQNNIAVDTAKNTIILIDCDSFDLTDRVTKEHFPCTVGMQEMLAPELQTAGSLIHKKFTKESDNFSLAIHIFRLLMKNADPFGGVMKKKASMTSIPLNRAILNGECAYVRHVSGKQIPSWSVTLDILPDEVVRLFKKTFSYTLSSSKKNISNRATAKEWCAALSPLLTAKSNVLLKTCKKDKLHIYPAHNKQCPWCKCESQRDSKKKKKFKKWIAAAAAGALLISTGIFHFAGIVEIPYVNDVIKDVELLIEEYKNKQIEEEKKNPDALQIESEENLWNEIPEPSEEAGTGLSYTEEYILPESDGRYITEEELSALSADEILLARNEIFARHGRKFRTEWIQTYFENTSWYRGIYEPEIFDGMTDTIFNSYEKANIETIVSYEQKMGYQ